MNIQSFYEYVILRDILAFILPGGVSLAGIYMVMQSVGMDRWEKTLPFLTKPVSFLTSALLVLIAFLIGHVWDMVYRLKFQTNEQFERKSTIRKMLMGDEAGNPKSIENHIANQIRLSVGEFLNINWNKMPIKEWVNSRKAYQLSLLLSYWIEEEDPKLFSAEIGRPTIQSHMLHVCGLAFYFFSFCTLLSSVIYLSLHLAGFNPIQLNDLIFLLIVLVILAIMSWRFGKALIDQGTHKRDIIMEHAFRVFYVVWRKRTLERKNKNRRSASKPKTV